MRWSDEEQSGTVQIKKKLLLLYLLYITITLIFNLTLVTKNEIYLKSKKEAKFKLGIIFVKFKFIAYTDINSIYKLRSYT